MTSELRPCPQCKQIPVVKGRKDKPWLKNKKWAIVCGCGAECYLWETKKGAIESYNRSLEQTP